MSLRQRESIAGAVAREIDRIQLTGEHHGEGAAYKAAWDRQGSSFYKHAAARAADAFLFLRPPSMRRLAARFEAGRA